VLVGVQVYVLQYDYESWAAWNTAGIKQTPYNDTVGRPYPQSSWEESGHY
jgi:hypothetical protein